MEKKHEHDEECGSWGCDLPPLIKKTCLGGDLYATYNEGAIILTTENSRFPVNPVDQIVLRPPEWERLLLFISSVKYKGGVHV